MSKPIKCRAPAALKSRWPGLPDETVHVLRKGIVPGQTGWFVVRFADGGRQTVHESNFA